MERNRQFDNQYELRLSHRHVRVLIRALDMFSRISIAQFERIIEQVEFELSQPVRQLVRGLFDEAKYLMYDLAPNASKSICDHTLPEDVHISYEIEKVLQKIIAEIEDHDHWSVWRDGPMKLSTEPLPEIRETYVPDLPFAERRLGGIHPGDWVKTKWYRRQMINGARYGIKKGSVGVVYEVKMHENLVLFDCVDAPVVMWDTDLEILPEEPRTNRRECVATTRTT